MHAVWYEDFELCVGNVPICITLETLYHHSNSASTLTLILVLCNVYNFIVLRNIYAAK